MCCTNVDQRCPEQPNLAWLFIQREVAVDLATRIATIHESMEKSEVKIMANQILHHIDVLKCRKPHLCSASPFTSTRTKTSALVSPPQVTASRTIICPIRSTMRSSRIRTSTPSITTPDTGLAIAHFTKLQDVLRNPKLLQCNQQNELWSPDAIVALERKQYEVPWTVWRGNTIAVNKAGLGFQSTSDLHASTVTSDLARQFRRCCTEFIRLIPIQWLTTN